MLEVALLNHYTYDMGVSHKKMVLLMLLSWLLFMSSTAVCFADNKSFDDNYVHINTVRKSKAVNELEFDSILEKAAQNHANDMLARGYLSHLDKNNNQAINRIRSEGGNYLQAGEIIGRGPDMPSIIDAWLESPLHKQELLNDAYTHMGIGSVKTDTSLIAVACFSTIYFEITEISTAGHDTNDNAATIKAVVLAENISQVIVKMFSASYPLTILRITPPSGDRKFAIPVPPDTMYVDLGVKRPGSTQYVQRVYLNSLTPR